MMFWIYTLSETHLRDSPLGSFLNVFQYQTVRGGVASLLAFLFCIVFGERVIRKLISLKVGQPIRSADEVHQLHSLHGGKAGTPTMGGVLFIGAVSLATLVCARWDNLFVWVVLFVFVSLGLLGFADDYHKVVKKSSVGVSMRAKLAVQFGITVLAGLVLYYAPAVASIVPDSFLSVAEGEAIHAHIARLYIPFLKVPLVEEMHVVLALALFLAVIVGASNAVNLTDGLDGLATGCTITAALAYGVLSYVVGHALAAQYLLLPNHPLTGELAIMCLALVGAGMGFLWFNCHPARVFMGDTGSLALGGMLGIVAICSKQEVLLVVIGGVFVMEAMSVILQVASFKLRGKRLFAMSPIHHHFELIGWKESQVIVRFWIMSIIFALVGLATLKLR
ncbi:phospho-N-acetylmuramoyl-pentapeptide-transferase [soil metagenome]